VTLTQLIRREVKAFIKNPGFIIGLVLIVSVYGLLGNITGGGGGGCGVSYEGGYRIERRVGFRREDEIS